MVQLKALPKFERAFKKFFAKEQDLIRTEISKIKSNPLLGEPKKGSLAGVRVHKFKLYHQLYLIAYEYQPKNKTLFLYAIGTHENYYDALERYLH